MELKEIYQSSLKRIEKLGFEESVLEHVKHEDRAWRDVKNKKDWLYYQWLAALMDVLKPKQVVELGGAMGVSALCMLSKLPKDSKLYSITLEEEGLEFSFIKKSYPQLIKIVGDDLDLRVWPKDMDWKATEVLFIDTEHTKDHLTKELELYLPLVGKGTLVLLDDIHLNSGMFEVWRSITHPKLNVSTLHHSGFGIFQT